MPPKKEKKNAKKEKGGKKRKKSADAEDPLSNRLITTEENHVLETKHENLIQRVLKTSSLKNEVESLVKENEDKKEALIDWENYLSCDKIPKAFEPQNIRNFIDKALHYENEDVADTINWTLSIDERSILCQDIDQPNKTRVFLKENRIDFGPQYDLRVTDTLKLIDRIQEYFKDPVPEVSKDVMNDIGELKKHSEKKICEFIDNLTYRVIQSEVAYMDPIDVISAEYSYHGQHFDIHIWAILNVPVYFNPAEVISKTVDLEQINVRLEVPFSVLSENMVIRGLHCSYDHLSYRARYYYLTVVDPIEKNLILCLEKEWETQKKLQTERKAKMMKDRADYEELVRLKAQENSAKEKKKAAAGGKEAPEKGEKKKKKKAGIKVPTKEPPIISPDMFPVIIKDFLNNESIEYATKIGQYHPHQLYLIDGEVNLREYQLLGGIYHINSVLKPNASNYPKLILTWYKRNKNLEHKPCQVMDDDSSVAKFFEITFELSSCFCNWDEPIACMFEDYTPPVPKSEKSSRNLKIGSPIIINDFNLHEIFTKPMMYDFIENALPRVISSFKFHDDFNPEDFDQPVKSSLGRPKTLAEDEEAKKQQEMQTHILRYDIQNSPERLFPSYKHNLPVVIMPNEGKTEEPGTHAYEHFSDFMSALDEIKNSYKKTKFRDKFGNPVKILGEEYEGNIRKPRISTKLTVNEETKSLDRGSVADSARGSMSSRRGSEQRGSARLSSISDDIRHFQKKKKTRSSLSKEDNHHHVRMSGDGDGSTVIPNFFAHWSTKNILKTEFNRTEQTIKIWTDRLGSFGFAYPRYQHFPFNNWSLHPVEEKVNEFEFELHLESNHALFTIYISKDGYKAYVTDFALKVKQLKIYLQMNEYVSNFGVFKKILQEACLNIFPEVDALWYVQGEYLEKHLSAELHTYDIMCLNASTFKYISSRFNKQANRRTMILELAELNAITEELFLIRVTPEDSMFVELHEKVDKTGATKIEFVPTWRNLEWYADLNQLIKSGFGITGDTSWKENMSFTNLKNLLHSIRPLSFS